MSRKIVISTEDLRGILMYAQNYKNFLVHDSDDNTDGEGAWHCDVEFFNENQLDGDPAVEVAYSFDGVKDDEETDI